jgi:LmbE family N-acetylglucosaminyl deacetylase
MTRPTHLYVSPHLDDAVLSVGGLIRAQLTAGDRVVIATVCTSDTPSQRLSPLAIEVHRRWGNPRAPYVRRRQEDIAACLALGGAECRHLGLPDAIYRFRPDSPECRYETFEDLFGPIPSWDRGFSASVAEAVDRLAIELQPQQVIGPLGVGRNVDHLHLRNVVMSMSNSRSVGFYEEQPYSTGRHPHTAPDPVKVAVRTCPIPVRAKTHLMEWGVKTHAIECYESQLPELFGPARPGIEVMAEYSRQLDVSQLTMERVWYAEPDGTLQAKPAHAMVTSLHRADRPKRCGPNGESRVGDLEVAGLGEPRYNTGL